MGKTPKITCRICGRTLFEMEFYLRNGTPIDICKDCCTANLDISNPDTFMWVLKELDLPFDKERFYRVFDEKMRKDGPNYSRKGAFGIYVRTVKTRLSKERSTYTFADTERINQENDRRRQILLDSSDTLSLGERKAREAMLSNGEALRQEALIQQKEQAALETVEALRSVEDELGNSLTLDDKRYLANKWGTSYSPTEWLKMEDLYTRYAAEYDLNVDREETLRKICKTSLKMDQALDDGDLTGYRALSQVLDALRKSGKFTEVQNKEDRADLISSVGQLVLLCERNGGVIEHLPPAEDYPRDKIDLTINDYKQYAVSLLKNEPNISGIIEAYVNKLDEAQKKTEEFLSTGHMPHTPAVYEFGDDGVGGYGYPVGDDVPEMSQDDADYIRALLIKDGLIPSEEGLDVEKALEGRDITDLYYM